LNKAIEILKEAQKELNRHIKFYKQEIEYNKKSIARLIDPSHREFLLTKNMWSDKWTVDDFITTNLDSSERALKQYTDLLDNASSELRDIKTALKILKESVCENESSGKKTG
jgi:F0F1-type ATP synthase membrane subunit b/b'